MRVYREGGHFILVILSSSSSTLFSFSSLSSDAIRPVWRSNCWWILTVVEGS